MCIRPIRNSHFFFVPAYTSWWHQIVFAALGKIKIPILEIIQLNDIPNFRMPEGDSQGENCIVWNYPSKQLILPSPPPALFKWSCCRCWRLETLESVLLSISWWNIIFVVFWLNGGWKMDALETGHTRNVRWLSVNSQQRYFFDIHFSIKQSKRWKSQQNPSDFGPEKFKLRWTNAILSCGTIFLKYFSKIVFSIASSIIYFVSNPHAGIRIQYTLHKCMDYSKKNSPTCGIVWRNNFHDNVKCIALQFPGSKIWVAIKKITLTFKWYGRCADNGQTQGH